MSDLYTHLRDALKEQRAVAMATVTGGPAYVGNKLLVFPGGQAEGSTGSDQLNEKVRVDAEQAIWRGEAAIHTYSVQTAQGTQTFDVFIEGFPPPPELIIVGAGHIAIPLTSFAKTLGYRVVIVDARAAFATRERFPHADELIVSWPDEILATRPLYPSTSVAVLTHDPKFDEPTLQIVLSRHTGYIGAIGSRKTSAERAQRLLHLGLTEEQVARIHAPIGLPLGASSPEEIALAIIAEIVATRHGKSVRLA